MIKDDLKIISYNVRGLNNNRKRFSIYNFLKRCNCDIAFLQETYSSKDAEIKWVQDWGGSGVFVHGTKHSKGVAILFRRLLDVEILSVRRDTQGRFIILKCKVQDEPFNLINIYAPNRENDQVQFTTDLIKVMVLEGISNVDNNIIGGDWNVALDDKLDKLGGITNIKHKSLEKIVELKSLYDLEDVWRLKHENIKRYTWRQKTPRIHCRLDYFLIFRQVLDYTVKSDIMPSILSDHSPVLLVLKYLPEPQLGAGTWKLNTSLLNLENYVVSIKQKLTDWLDMYKDLTNENLKWEIIKYEIRQFSIKFSKTRKKVMIDKEKDLETRLKLLENSENQNDEQIFSEIDRIREQLKD